MTTIGIAQAKAQIASLVDRAAAGEVIMITRKGIPVAVLVSPDAMIAPAFDLNGASAAPKSTPAPRSTAPTHPSPSPPVATPQRPGLTLADILKLSR